MGKDIEVEIFLEGNKPFKAQLKDVKKETKKTEKTFTSLGKSLIVLNQGFQLLSGVVRVASRALGSIIEVGKGALQAASDFEEANQKFEVIFSNLRAESRATRDELVNNFGLSKTASTELLAATGDLLTGFGFAQGAALDLSGTVNKLAADLASFSNLEGGAARASEILTKALLGERDALVSLGVKIAETDVQARLLADGNSELTGTALRQAKAQATLALILEQTKNAQGDFERSSSSLANQQRILTSRLEDLEAQLGEALIPAAQAFIAEINVVVEEMSNWAKENDELIKSNVLEFAKSFANLMVFAAEAIIFVVKGINNFLAGIKLIQAGFAALASVANFALKGIVDGFVFLSEIGPELILKSLKFIGLTFLEFVRDTVNLLRSSEIFAAILPDSVVANLDKSIGTINQKIADLAATKPTGVTFVTQAMRDFSAVLENNIKITETFRKEQEDAAVALVDNNDILDDLEKKINLVNTRIQKNLDLRKEQGKVAVDLNDEEDRKLVAELEAEKTRLLIVGIQDRKTALQAFNEFQLDTEEGLIATIKENAAQQLAGLKFASEQDLDIRRNQAALKIEIEQSEAEQIAAVKAQAREQQLDADKTFLDALAEQFNVNAEQIRDSGDIAFVAFRDFAVDAFTTAKASADDFFFGLITGADNAGQLFKQFGLGLLKSLISTLTKMAVQELIFSKISGNLKANSSTGKITADAAVGAAAAFRSALEAVPYPANLIAAPASAAFASSSILSFISAAQAPRFQHGLDLVQRAEQPALLHLGETVLTRNETAGLRDFLDGGDTRGGGSNINITIDNLQLLADDETAIGNLTTAIRRSIEEQNLEAI